MHKVNTEKVILNYKKNPFLSESDSLVLKVMKQSVRVSQQVPHKVDAYGSHGKESNAMSVYFL